MKKYFMIGIILRIVLAAVFLLRKPWLNNDQEAVEYLNRHYSFNRGKIDKYDYLEKGHSDELGDYLKYCVTFENGEISIIRVYVELHNHLSMIGPDFRIKTCRVFDSDIVMNPGSYTAVNPRNTNVLIKVIIKNDGKYDLLNYPEADNEDYGEWVIKDNVLSLKKADGSEVMSFITDGTVLVYQKDLPGDDSLLKDGEVFFSE